MNSFFYIILTVNCLWFLAAFKTFSLTPVATCKMLRPDLPKDDPRTEIVAPAIRFLGGMNLGLFFLNAMGLYYLSTDFHSATLSLILMSSAVAHGTQFAFNLPHLKGLQGGAVWDVLKGPMLFIFLMDLTASILNLIGFFC